MAWFWRFSIIPCHVSSSLTQPGTKAIAHCYSNGQLWGNWIDLADFVAATVQTGGNRLGPLLIGLKRACLGCFDLWLFPAKLKSKLILQSQISKMGSHAFENSAAFTVSCHHV